MRVLILGLPGSGTSLFAGLLKAHGFDPASPTFSKGGGYGYDPCESLQGRAINRIAIGDTTGDDWPAERWFHDFRPRDCSKDVELHALARQFVRDNDRRSKRWFFKNPETLLAWRGLWGCLTNYGKANAPPLMWHHIIGVYRHPHETVHRLHSVEPESQRRVVWRRYVDLLARVSTVTARFPDDAEALCEALGLPGLPDGWEPDHEPRHSSTEPIEDWCEKTWRRLEAKRCTSTAATRT